MAGIGFSCQNSPLVFDSFMVPPNISNNLSTSIQEETTCFSHICPFDYFLQDIPILPPLLDTINTSTTTSNPNSSSSSSSSSSLMKLETRAQNQAISKVLTGSVVKSREKKKKKKVIDISKVEKEGNKKGRKEKRKSDAMLKVITEEKKLKAAAEDHHHRKKAKKEDDNITPTTTTTGYVHVRARRGEATDSHSLAERVRREKIGERMRLLQSLVPGCDKIRGKAQVLDKIINYVQSMQNQVQFLLAKHASLGVGPMFNEFEFDFDANPLVSEGNGVPSYEISEQIIMELLNQDAELNNLYHFY